MVTNDRFPLGDSTLLVTGKGRVVAMWTTFVSGQRRAMASIRPPKGQFGLAVPVSGTGNLVNWWDAAASKKGAVTAVWQESDGMNDRIMVADLSAKALQFTPALAISPAGEDNQAPAVGIDKKGNTTVAWANGNELGIEVAVRPAKGVFGTIQEVAPERDVSLPINLEVADSGHAVLAWRSDVPPDPNQIVASVRLPGGAFQPYQTVSDPTEFSGNPTAAIDSKGNAVVGFDPQRLVSLAAGDTVFSAPATEAVHQFPIYKYDKKGNLYFLTTNWFVPTNEASFAMRPAGSGTFESPALFAMTGVELYGRDIAVDKKGNVRVVLAGYHGMGVARIYTAYRPAGGSFGLLEALTPADGNCDDADVVSDKKGTWIVTYSCTNPDTLLTELWVTTQPKS